MSTLLLAAARQRGVVFVLHTVVVHHVTMSCVLSSFFYCFFFLKSFGWIMSCHAMKSCCWCVFTALAAHYQQNLGRWDRYGNARVHDIPRSHARIESFYYYYYLFLYIVCIYFQDINQFTTSCRELLFCAMYNSYVTCVRAILVRRWFLTRS